MNYCNCRMVLLQGLKNKVSQSSVIDVPSPEVNEEVKPERLNVEPVDPSSIE